MNKKILNILTYIFGILVVLLIIGLIVYVSIKNDQNKKYELNMVNCFNYDLTENANIIIDNYFQMKYYDSKFFVLDTTDDDKELYYLNVRNDTIFLYDIDKQINVIKMQKINTINNIYNISLCHQNEKVYYLENSNDELHLYLNNASNLITNIKKYNTCKNLLLWNDLNINIQTNCFDERLAMSIKGHDTTPTYIVPFIIYLYYS